MSGDHGNAPDLDLLADFTAGVLDGTPEGAAVADRIAADPEWAELHAALVRADEAVRAELTALPVEPMPADVFARLDAAFAAERAGVARQAAERAETVTAGTATPATTGRSARRQPTSSRRQAGQGRAAAAPAGLADGGRSGGGGARRAHGRHDRR